MREVMIAILPGVPNRDCGGLFTSSLSAITARRFLPPWSVEDIGACFVVKDHNG
jgi:hypothetical protein